MTYTDIIQNLVNNLAEKFSEVYHSAELVRIFDEGKLKEKFPGINRGREWIELAPTDVTDTIYIRRNGDDNLSEEIRLGSCTKAFKMRTPLRIVYFNDHGNSEKALFDLMQAVLSQSVKPVTIIRDKFKLLSEESTGDYDFSPMTVYLAIDVNIFWDLLSDKCDQDFCITMDNPIRKCEPVIESGS